MINIKAKADLKFSIMVWDADSLCPKDDCPSYSIFVMI